MSRPVDGPNERSSAPLSTRRASTVVVLETRKRTAFPPAFTGIRASGTFTGAGGKPGRRHCARSASSTVTRPKGPEPMTRWPSRASSAEVAPLSRSTSTARSSSMAQARRGSFDATTRVKQHATDRKSAPSPPTRRAPSTADDGHQLLGGDGFGPVRQRHSRRLGRGQRLRSRVGTRTAARVPVGEAADGGRSPEATTDRGRWWSWTWPDVVVCSDAGWSS